MKARRNRGEILLKARAAEQSAFELFSDSLSHSASNMPRGTSYKAVRNETKYPYIAELPVSVRGLDVVLSRRIVQFHKTRHVQPRHGRTILSERQHYYRWCFSDLQMAHEFIKQFGGSLCEPDRKGSR